MERINAPIGVFDSGVGGLSVLKKLKNTLPHESFIYVGDTARAPYGVRSESEIREFVEEILDYFEKKQVKLVVVACNTITMLGINTLKKNHSFDLIGMEKDSQLLVELSKTKKVGVLATPFTVNSGFHKKAILALDPNFQVFYQACDDFVPIIESGDFASLKKDEAVKKYTKPMLNYGVDTVILACTHYPFLQKDIEKELGEAIKVIDPAEATSDVAKKYLVENGLAKTKGSRDILVNMTSNPELAKKVASHIFDVADLRFKKIELTKLI
jgi:glutamate racemase